MSEAPQIAAIAIGRNEGTRLEACLLSLVGQANPIVYVDSGSTDGSVEMARGRGATVVELDMSVPFTAARARNAGIARVREVAPDVVFIQFLDGDCALDANWIDTARAVLLADPNLAVVCGRRRERFPKASLWNQMIDNEWDTPIGEARACGGDALMRIEALEAVGGYPDQMIAGEEPEMCFRMRRQGWRIRRLDAEMTLHDAAMTKVSQWWQRSRRAGHAYGEGAALHGRETDERYNVAETRRALLWGVVVPGVAVLGSLFVTPWAMLILFAWPLQVLRLAAKGMAFQEAFFMVAGKMPESQGVLGYWKNRVTGKQRRLIEYK